MTEIKWKGSEQLRPMLVEVSSLHSDPENARKHDARNLGAISASYQHFGQQKPIVIDKNQRVVAGNGTLEAVIKIGWTHIAVVRSDLTDPVALRAFGIADNRTAELAEWDTQALASAMSTISSDIALFAATGFDQKSLEEVIDASAASAEDTAYTRKIEAPIYTPKRQEQPSVAELFDQTKTQELLANIEKATGLTDEVRRFLVAAASRHTAFDYEEIAEFYCHADSATQKLFEDSALVIIDFDSAVEGGFVQLSEKLRVLAGEAEAINKGGKR